MIRILKTYVCPKCSGGITYIRCFGHNEDGSWHGGYRCQECGLEEKDRSKLAKSKPSDHEQVTSDKEDYK